jgi:hypothetical protein
MSPLPSEIRLGEEPPMTVASELAESRVKVFVIQLGSFRGNVVLPEPNAEARFMGPM